MHQVFSSASHGADEGSTVAFQKVKRLVKPVDVLSAAAGVSLDAAPFVAQDNAGFLQLVQVCTHQILGVWPSD